MAKVSTDEKSGLSYRIWKDADGVTRSRPLGRQSQDVLALIGEAFDDGVDHGRATQGRRKGKPLVRVEETLGAYRSFCK